MSSFRLFAFILLSAFIELSAQSDVDVTLVPFASGFDRPVDIVHAGDGRLFVVEKAGLIKIVREDGTVDPVPFLDITSLTSTSGANSERGLLGLTFHPDYSENGHFYVNYTDIAQDTRVSRFTVTQNPDIADLSSKEEILFIDQPFGNHNGGCLRFGPNGNLYIGTGDGGSSEDPFENGQDMSTLLGKMLRINVDGELPYKIPSSNPFRETISDTVPEIWASGLRNPWRFSFDRLTGDLWIGDVGQYAWEEVDYQPYDSDGGENYGWSCYEGNHPGFQSPCPPMSAFDPPVAEYSHDAGHCSITGGYVYRGSSYPSLYGKYFYMDYCSGQMWSTEPDAEGGWAQFQVSTTLGFGWTSFGEDVNGELYAANQIENVIYRIGSETCSSFATSPVDLTKSFDPVGGVQDRVQLKWFKAIPEQRYSDEDAAACDIKFWAKRNLNPITGEPIGPMILDPDTILIEDAKKFYPDDSPREIFKWPVKFKAEGANNTKRVDPNIRYEWQVRCACEHGLGPESPWSAVKTFNTPDFDPSTGILSSAIEAGNESKVASFDFAIHPNPSMGETLVIRNAIGFKGTVRIIDVHGRELYRREMDSRKTERIMLDQKLRPGVYIIQLTGQSRSASNRFLVGGE